MPSNAHYRLTIAAPREKGLWSGGLKYETSIIGALKSHLSLLPSGPGNTAIEVCLSFLLSERPYVLPLLLDENEAKSLADDLTTAGCNVKIVPFGQ